MSYMGLDEERDQYVEISKQLPSNQLHMTFEPHTNSDVDKTSTTNLLSGVFSIHNEGHTTANLLRYGLLTNPDVSFVGHCEPHPLEEKLCLDVTLRGGNGAAANDVRQVMKATVQERILHIHTIRQSLRGGGVSE